MNFFSHKSAAARYTAGRPFFHPVIIERIKDYLSPSEPFSPALDVGCGTGLSTLALREMARRVFGLDASAEMLALAHRDARVKYLLAEAAHLPFAAARFELVTVSQAIHWFGRSEFLGEARRVLSSGGWLIIYDNYFSDRMKENPSFRKWHRESYLAKYPSPPREWASFTLEESQSEGFHLAHHEWYQNTITFSLEGLVDYLLTQSNLIAAVEGGGESVEEARAWLTEGLAPLYRELKEAAFTFNAPIWYLQKFT